MIHSKIWVLVAQVSGERGTSSFRYGTDKKSELVGWSVDSYFRSSDDFTVLSLENGNFRVN